MQGMKREMTFDGLTSCHQSLRYHLSTDISNHSSVIRTQSLLAYLATKHSPSHQWPPQLLASCPTDVNFHDIDSLGNQSPIRLMLVFLLMRLIIGKSGDSWQRLHISKAKGKADDTWKFQTWFIDELRLR
jgi:hypothetical protein